MHKKPDTMTIGDETFDIVDVPYVGPGGEIRMITELRPQRQVTQSTEVAAAAPKCGSR